MGEITAAELAKVNSFPKLVELLEEKLGWPIKGYDLEDLTYEYEAKELGLKPDETATIREIHQLRPLETNQPWGVFFISFEDKAISVTVLRRILRNLIVKKRAGVQAAERQAWDRNDLIFAANFGKLGERELAFVHFSDGAATGDLPVMKVLGWNAKDAKLHNDHVGRTLADKLRWPDDPADHAAWRAQWASAFELRLNETIKTSKELAVRLAGLATDIRARANQLLAAETDTGPMQTMLAAFRKNLIQDLDEDGFADMFAQTICYGLLAASISKLSTDPDIVASGMAQPTLVADNIADMVPRTNPFLKELFGNFLKLGGRDRRSGFDFDELGVRDVVDMLNAANMPAVLRDFGNRNPKKDPVIHFYEDFLREYDRDQKVDAGIFYTPPAVVGFIVRGVDEMLREAFGLPLGLADTTSWGELAARNDKITVSDHIDPAQPFVQILDPATGTGTFLVEVIDLIHTRMVEHWKALGKRDAQIVEAWNAYVPKHLLPRLTAFELKMAAYAIAHMKIGLKLNETGYRIQDGDRLHVLLTNALLPPRRAGDQDALFGDALAHEGERADEAKAKTPFTVVIGNPPYKGHSMNPSKVKGKLTFAGEIVQRFFQVRGEPLGEKNPKWLNNDYVKFIALAMHQIEQTGTGVIGYITSNSWLDSPTFRGVRTEMMDSFPVLLIVDLHGNVSKAETASDGKKDEGVFAISEGTAILVAAHKTDIQSIKTHDLLGPFDESQGGKIRWLETENLERIQTPLHPTPPFFVLVPSDETNKDEFYSRKLITDLFPLNSVGFVTANDALTIQFSKDEIVSVSTSLAQIDLEKAKGEISQKSNPKEWRVAITADGAKIFPKKKAEARDWRVEWAQRDLSKHIEGNGKPRTVRYRPFDLRWTYFTGNTRGFMCMPRGEFMELFGSSSWQNVGLVTSRMTKGEEFAHVHVTQEPAEVIGLSPKTSNNAFVYPLWLKPSAGEAHRRPNIDRKFAQGFGAAVGLTYEDGIERGKQESLGAEFRHEPPEQLSLDKALWDGRGDLQRTFGPRDLFDWIYAVLHSPTYRTRYAEFLKSDFPRVPTPGSLKLLQALVPLGRDLVALHLLRPEEVPVLNDPARFDPAITFNGTGEARVEKGYPKYENGKVMINSSRWFEDVPKETWDFHVGGYQVCEKWLKDRAAKGGKKASTGRVLTDEDILHYRRVVVALTETRRLMAEIDQVIEKHGGWPGAFQTGEANGKT